MLHSKLSLAASLALLVALYGCSSSSSLPSDDRQAETADIFPADTQGSNSAESAEIEVNPNELSSLEENAETDASLPTDESEIEEGGIANDEEQSAAPQNSPDSSPLAMEDPDQTSTQSSISLVVNGYALIRNERVRLDGTVYHINQFDIDTVNNRITHNISSDEGVNVLRPYQESTYDEVGNRTQLLDYETDRFSTFRIEYLYDSNGRLTQENTYRLSNGELFQAVEYQYDENGRLTRKLGTLGFYRSRISVSYDDQNRLTSTTRETLEEDGVSTVGGVSQLRLQSDDGSNLIRRAETVNQDGISASGYSIYNYDQIGNMTRIDWFREDGSAWFTDRFIYEETSEPVYNHWLQTMRFFPSEIRYPL